MREPHTAHAHIHTPTHTHARTHAHTHIRHTCRSGIHVRIYTLVVVIATAFNHVSQAARRRQASRRRSSATSYSPYLGRQTSTLLEHTSRFSYDTQYTTHTRYFRRIPRISRTRDRTMHFFMRRSRRLSPENARELSLSR